VYQLSFGAGVAKAIGTYPGTGTSNQQHAYDPVNHMFYLQQATRASPLLFCCLCVRWFWGYCVRECAFVVLQSLLDLDTCMG
jgi:hypothetical protein